MPQFAPDNLNCIIYHPEVINSFPYLWDYSVTVTDVGGCVGVQGVASGSTIWVSPPTPQIVFEESSQISNDGIVCKGDEVKLTASGGISFLWSTGETGNFIIVRPVSTSIYSVIVTDKNGCTNETEVLIYAEDCNCTCVETTLNIGAFGETILLSENLPFDHLDNTCLSIAGELFVDIDYTINGGSIIMRPGSKISLGNYQTFTLENVKEEGVGGKLRIYGCGQMWKGIDVPGGANLVINNCIIQDAETAVNVSFAGETSIYATKFLNNIYSLQMNLAILSRFEGNIIKGTGEMLVPFSQNFPILDKPLVGITLWGGNIYNDYSISGESLASNYFQNLEKGILIHNSDLSINNCEMQGIGTGINISNLNNSFNPVIDIQNNSISASSNAILLNQTGSALSINISNNDLYAIDNGSYAIQVNESTERTINPAIIRYNKIFLDANNTTGIELLSASKFEIEENIIECRVDGTLDGIYVKNSDGVKIKSNAISGYNGSTSNGFNINIEDVDNPSTGIKVEMTENGEYACNLTTHLHNGIAFEVSACYGSDIHDNTFVGEHFIGLHYKGNKMVNDQVMNLLINSQTHKFNKWLGGDQNYISAAVSNDIGTSFIDDVQDQRYTVSSDNIYGNWYPPIENLDMNVVLPNYTGVDVDWFLSVPTNLEANCDYPWGHNSIFTSDDFWEVDPHYSPLYNWRIQKHAQVFKDKLVGTPIPFDEEGIYGQYFESLEGSKIEAFHLVDKEIKEAFLIPAELKNDWVSLKLKKQNLEAIILIKEAALTEDENDPLWTTYNQLIKKKEELVIDLENLLEYITIVKAGKVQAAIISNDGLTPEAIFQHNERNINAIFLRTLTLGYIAYTEAGEKSIFDIAAQCPLIGGKAVYEARSLYRLHYPNISFDDACESKIKARSSTKESGGRESIVNQGVKQKQSSIKQIKIFPNPAKDILVVQCNNLSLNTAFVLYNIYGQEVKKSPLQDGQANINVSSISKGVYFIKIYDATGVLYNQTLINSKRGICFARYLFF